MQAIGHLIPIALAVAISSVPIMAMIFMLLSPGRNRSAVPYMVGWILGIVIVLSVCALLAHTVPTASSDRQPDVAVGIAEIIVGIALIGVAFFSWRRSRRPETPKTPAWLSSAGKLGPWSSLGLGLVLNVRPKGILLAIAAGLTLRADADTPSVVVVSIVVYTLIAASTVTIPIIATVAAPKRMEPRLVSVHDWMLRNGGLLTGVIVGFIGVFVIGTGIGRL
ncbi:GAP family protein [uncultured Microbacterium sp.]|uniref:GAP family protein n=1 Tax=uncultured Microbacterium sp. TaxID=191216 RepID=UPI0035CAE7F5